MNITGLITLTFTIVGCLTCVYFTLSLIEYMYNKIKNQL